MPITQCKAEVIETKQLTHDVRELAFRFEEPSHLEYTAGQYVNFRVQDPTRDKLVSRLYSINSAPSEAGVLRVVYNFVGGPGTSYLQGLQVGDAVEFKGPFGHFVLKDDDNAQNVLFVATGTGIAPFRSMLFDRLPQGDARNFTLLWSVREERDLYYQEEFAALAEQYENFRFLPTLTRPAEGWQGLKGRVTAIFPEYYPSVENLAVYACGTDAMIQDLKQLCVDRGECAFYREKYF